jgi:predicted TIM-barrel fold metal-dependent hydrolase
LGVIPTYLPAHYDEDARSAVGFKFQAAVHVEAIVGQKPGGFVMDPVDETRWIDSLEYQVPHTIVAYVHLARDDAGTIIEQHRESKRFVGVRMCMNYHDQDASLTWPQVEQDFLIKGSAGHAALRRGYGLLEQYQLSFDMHANPHQLCDAANFLADFPRVPVCVDHLGCPKLGQGAEQDETTLRIWREGIKALAALPHVSIKLSGPSYILRNFAEDPEKDAIVAGLFREVIAAFGVDRCMFASNFPVDKFMGTSWAALYGAFGRWTRDFSEEDRSKLFHDNARKFYKVVGGE